MIDIYNRTDTLPSLSTDYLKHTQDNLKLVYHHVFSDSLYKEHANVPNDENCSDNLDELTVIIFQSDTFLNMTENTMELLLDYYSHLGVSNMILLGNKDSETIREFNHEFSTFKIVADNNMTLPQLLNKAINEVETNYLLVCDDNTIISENNFLKCYHAINGNCDFVYPSKRLFHKINSTDNFLKTFDTAELEYDAEEELFFDVNFVFSKTESLKRVGAYNPGLKTHHVMSTELLLRINFSQYTARHMDNVLYLFGYPQIISDYDDEKELIKQFNLSRLNDFNVLVNQDPEMFYFVNDNFYEDHFNHTGKYRISVITPVYNCDAFYLDRCISSLKNQTIGFENIELIIVDDKSEYEESLEMLKRYENSFENIKVYYLNSNGGSGIARNVGISKVTTDYVLFLDHDDYYVKDYCEKAYAALNNNEIDIYISSHIKLNISSIPIKFNTLKLDDGKKLIKSYKEDHNVLRVSPEIWAKGYRTQFLRKEDVSFSGFNTAEDTLFNMLSLFNANGIYLEDNISVIYDLRDNEKKELRSVSLQFDKENLITKIRVYNEILSLYEQYAPDEKYFFINTMHYWIRYQLMPSKLFFNDFKLVMKEAYALFKKMVDDERFIIRQEFREFFRLVSEENYVKAYDAYLKLQIRDIT